MSHEPDAEWAVLTAVQGIFEETQLEAFLEAHGIGCRAHGEALRKTHALVLDGLGAVTILVRTEDLATARELLEQVERGDLELPDEG